jgi:hypothetical protein
MRAMAVPPRRARLPELGRAKQPGACALSLSEAADLIAPSVGLGRGLLRHDHRTESFVTYIDSLLSWRVWVLVKYI